MAAHTSDSDSDTAQLSQRSARLRVCPTCATRVCLHTVRMVCAPGLCAHCMHTALTSPAAASINHTTLSVHWCTHTPTAHTCGSLITSQLLSAGMLARVMNVNPSSRPSIHSCCCSAKSGQTNPSTPKASRKPQNDVKDVSPITPPFTQARGSPHCPIPQAHASTTWACRGMWLSCDSQRGPM